MPQVTEPPVPPPPPLQKATAKTLPITAPNLKVLLDECLWALSWPELQKACYLARICTVDPPKKCQFFNIRSQLQVGPTCGLTALSMLLGGIPTAQEILRTAQDLNFTINGELFSVNYLYQLAKKYVSENCTGKENVSQYRGALDCEEVRQTLQNNSCIFVPYDPDVNHSPCLKYGHKAHWALIIGYLITNDDDFFVVARNGKARNIAVWSLKALSESNSNLVEFAQPNGYPDHKFLLPPDGISGELGLREQAVIVKNVKHDKTIIK